MSPVRFWDRPPFFCLFSEGKKITKPQGFTSQSRQAILHIFTRRQPLFTKIAVSPCLRSRLPGKPDIALPKYKTVIEVRGCYWHRHEGCKDATTPSTNTEFWQKKFAENVARDKRTEQELKALGWNVFVVWECEVEKNLFQANLTNKIISGDINA